MRLAAILLLAFGLRLLRLAHLGDLEFDEIVSLRYASLPVGELVPRLAGALFEHPPAFYVALGWWRSMLAASGLPGDVQARLFSVFPGTLSVALTYACGRRLFDARTARLAALSVAVAPLPLFYSREARMYALVACLCLASFWLFLRAALRPAATRGPWIWVAYALVGAAAAYVHYLGALFLLAQLVAGLALRRRLGRRLGPLALATAAIFAAGLPWAIGASGTRESLPALAWGNVAAGTVAGAAGAALRALAAGPDADGVPATLAGLLLVPLIVAGFPRRGAAAVAVGAVTVAGVAGVLAVLALGKPFQARYLLPAAPVLYLCAARAVAQARPPAASWRVVPALAGGVLLLGAAPFWQRYYVDYERADYSAVTAEIRSLERPGDGILLTGPWQAWYFDYYYGGGLDHVVLPHDAPPALSPDEARGQLAQLAAGKQRLWFVQAGLAQADPSNFVERWLAAHAWPAYREAHQNAVLSLYSLDEPELKRPLRAATFGGALRLTGGWVDGGEVTSGNVVRLELQLQALRPLSAGYKASLRLVGADGQRTSVDFDLLDRTDEQERPASQWAVGQRVTVRRGLWAPPALGPQPYEVRLVIYDPGTLEPLAPQVDGSGAAIPAGPAEPAGDWPGGELPVGGVYVTQSLAALPPPAAPAVTPAQRRFGGGDFDTMELRGVRWQQADPSAGPLVMDLLWRLQGLSGTEHRSTLSVVDAQGTVWSEEERPLVAGTFLMWDWRENETIAERRSVDLTTLPAGDYRVLVGLRDSRGRMLPADGPLGREEVLRLRLPYHRPLAERAAGALERAQRRLRTLPLLRVALAAGQGK